MKIKILCGLVSFVCCAYLYAQAISRVTLPESYAVTTLAVAHNDLYAKTNTAVRECVISNVTYMVKYEYNPHFGSMPATFGAKMHHGAKITVFRVEPVGKPFDGTYVDGGCFEDVPAEQVAKALNQK